MTEAEYSTEELSAMVHLELLRGETDNEDARRACFVAMRAIDNLARQRMFVPLIKKLIEAASTYDSYLAKEIADELKSADSTKE